MNNRNISLPDRFRLLEKVYQWYDEIAWSFADWACRPGCSACCTSSVILTTLEAAFMWERYSKLLKERMPAEPTDGLLSPLRMTTNEQAALCMAKQDFKDDTEPIAGSRCPLLADNRCMCYEARPLMCRIMFSTVPCETTGEAETPGILLSLNIACLQLVEHIDRDGWSGYLSHLLPHCGDEEFMRAYVEGKDQPSDSRLRANRPNPGFLIPPEHQARVKNWLAEFDKLQSGS